MLLNILCGAIVVSFVLLIVASAVVAIITVVEFLIEIIKGRLL